VGTASADVRDPSQRRSIVVWAHLDTGAGKTTLASALANHLGLVPTGAIPVNTAGRGVITDAGPLPSVREADT
jgi:hypothetical protein